MRILFNSDHAGGNKELMEHLHCLHNCKIRIFAADNRVASLTNLVSHNSHIHVGKHLIRVLETPWYAYILLLC